MAEEAIGEEYDLKGDAGAELKIGLLRFCLMRYAAVVDVIMVPLLGMGLFSVFGGASLPKWLTGNAFSVYLMHGIFIKVSIFILIVLGVRNIMDDSLAVWFARVFFAVGMSIGFTVILKKYLPRVSWLLFGGR